MPERYTKPVKMSRLAILTEHDKDVFRFVHGDFFEIGSNEGFDRSRVPIVRNRLRLIIRLPHINDSVIYY